MLRTKNKRLVKRFHDSLEINYLTVGTEFLSLGSEEYEETLGKLLLYYCTTQKSQRHLQHGR